MYAITLVIQCPDKKGIIADVTSFVYAHKGNIQLYPKQLALIYEREYSNLQWVANLQGTYKPEWYVL